MRHYVTPPINFIQIRTITALTQIIYRSKRFGFDAAALERFKAKQRGKRGYQTAINAALRRVVEDEMTRAG